MKTCPACHRAVPDDAATCPYAACGHHFALPHATIKRPPPPPAHAQVPDKDLRPATPWPAASQAALGWMKSRQTVIVLLSGIVLGLGLAALFVTAYLSSSRKANESVSINAPAQPPRQKNGSAPSEVVPPAKETAGKAPPPLPVDNSRPPDKSAAAADKKVAGAASGKSDSEPAPAAAKPDEPLGIVADPPKPESLGIPQDPKQAVIADTPKGLYEERTKPKTQELLGERGGTIQSQQAVEGGLNWLARHQGEDGHWGADCLGMAPNSRCDQNAPCQGTGEAYEIAHSGLALLAFQAAGHYYFNGQKYSDHVKKAGRLRHDRHFGISRRV